MLSVAIAAAVVLLAGSAQASEAQPELAFQLGTMGGVAYKVPTRLLREAVTYEDEMKCDSSGKPAVIPAERRTVLDPIYGFGFYVARDKPGEPQDANEALAEWSRLTMAGESGLYHGLYSAIALTIPPARNMPKLYAVPQGRGFVWKNDRPEHGLSVQRLVRPRTSDVADTLYVGAAGELDITCNTDSYAGADLSACTMTFLDRKHGAQLSVSFDRGDLPNWRTIRQSAIDIVETFTVRTVAGEPGEGLGLTEKHGDRR